MILSSPHAMARQIAYILFALISIGVAGLRGETGKPFEQSNAPLPLFTGYVTSTKGEVIDGAKIYITWTNSANDTELDPSVPPNDRILGSAISGPDGSYKVTWNQPTKPVRGEAEPRFYLTVLHPMWVPLQRGLVLNDSGDIRATIHLSTGVAYQSRVVDLEGKPVAGAKVRLEGCYKDIESTQFSSKIDGEVHLFMELSETLIASTNEKGEFSFPCLPESQCVLLRVQHPDYPSVSRLRSTTGVVPEVPEWVSRCPPEILEWWKDLGDDIRMGGRGRVKITVRELTSKRYVAGVEVAPYYSGISAKSNENGIVELPIDLRETMNTAYVRKTGAERWTMSSIYREDDNFVISMLNRPSDIRVRGTVREAESKRGLPGVRVVYKDNHQYKTTDQNGEFEFNVAGSLKEDAFVTVEGPLEGWMLPFRRKSNNPREPQIPSDSKKHRKSFKLDNDVSGIDFEVERIPETTILVLGLDGKPAPQAKVSISSNSAFHVKNVKTDLEGKVQVPLLADFGYLLYAQGASAGAAITPIEKLTTAEQVTVRLLPSVEVSGSAWLDDYEQDVFPAEGSIFGFAIQKEAAIKFEIGDEILHIEATRVDSDGKFSFRLPETEVPIEEWEIMSGGRWFHFRDRIWLNQDAKLTIQILRPIISNRP